MDMMRRRPELDDQLPDELRGKLSTEQQEKADDILRRTKRQEDRREFLRKLEDATTDKEASLSRANEELRAAFGETQGHDYAPLDEGKGTEDLVVEDVEVPKISGMKELPSPQKEQDAASDEDTSKGSDADAQAEKHWKEMQADLEDDLDEKPPSWRERLRRLFE
jgi:hypothetical protein